MLISFAFGLIILAASGYARFQPGILGAAFWILGLSWVLLAVFFLLGLLVSTLSHQSKTAMIVLMFVSAVVVLGMPRLSVIAAKLVRRVNDESVVLLHKRLPTDKIQKDKGDALRSLYLEKAIHRWLAKG